VAESEATLHVKQSRKEISQISQISRMFEWLSSFSLDHQHAFDRLGKELMQKRVQEHGSNGLDW
jgi:hypothetical protein